ncbi:MAG: hypothetical protein HY974_00635, partial [Candidatus Kerfeldbacteria bacterium]|nr:hypothetical protein [Candidatus Kerfeldbacteria bacterium]
MEPGSIDKSKSRVEFLQGDSWELPNDLALLEGVRQELARRLAAHGWTEEEAWQLISAC